MIKQKIQENLEAAKQKLNLEDLVQSPDQINESKQESKLDEEAKVNEEDRESDEEFELEPQEFVFLIDRSGSMYWNTDN